jgi:hypothetical protein
MIRKERDLKKRLLSPDMSEESTFMGGREGKEGGKLRRRERMRREEKIMERDRLRLKRIVKINSSKK